MGTQPYHTLDGKRVPGTTTITGRVKDASPLMWWSWNQAYPPLMQARALMRRLLSDPLEVVAATNFLSIPDDTFDFRKVRDSAADAGTCCHDQVECKIRGRAFDPAKYTSTAIEAAKPAFAAFEEWAQSTKLEVIETEKALVSQKHRYGGTLDAMGIQGKLSLLDWKTSKDVYAEYLLQLAGYAILWEENFPDRPIEGGFHLVRFSKQEKPTDPVSFSHRYWSHLDQAKAAFLRARALYEDIKDLEKLAK